MNKVKNLVYIGVALGVFAFSVYILKSCKPIVLSDGDVNPTIQVTPIAVTLTVQEKLPDDEIGVTQINVPTSKPKLGKVIDTYVVVTEKGNTYVAYTERIDWGIRIEPKIVIGYNGNLNLGIGSSIFRIYRFDMDVLVFGDLIDDFKLERNLHFGVGESFQASANTYIGANITWDFELKPKIGLYLALKF